MPKVLGPDEAYSGRAPGVAVLNCTVPREAKTLLQSWTATAKGLGDVVTQLALI